MKQSKKKIAMLIILIIILIHLPRIYIETKLRITNNKLHCEDIYQKSRNTGNNMNRIITWSYMDMSNTEWQEYIKNLQYNLINLYRKELGDLLRDVSDQDLVSFKTIDDETLLVPYGEIINTRIDNEKKILKSCFNHEWCSGYFILKYSSIIYNGKCPNIPKFPNTPFIPEYSLFKLMLNKPYLPISKCFTTNINKDKIKRLSYTFDLSVKPSGI